MTDGREWFAPKRYGYGATPVTWQGWALTFGFVALSVLLALALHNRPLQLIAIMVPLTVGFCVICALTTRGGWRWRWGGDD